MLRNIIALLAVDAAYALVLSPMITTTHAPLAPLAHLTTATPHPTMMADADKAVTLGAAGLGAFLGVYLFHEVSAALLLAVTFAYGTTVSNSFGDATRKAGEITSKGYDKVVELNAEYDLLPKGKTALDAATTAVSNINENYGITSKIDEKLQISPAIEKASAKVSDIKSSLTSKMDDLKAKSSSSE